MATRHDSSLQRQTGRGSDFAHLYNPLVAKLSAPVELSEEDRRAAHDICRNVREVEARRDVIKEGDNPRHVHVIMEGWAARYKVVSDGARQITAILIPGDFCDLHVTILGQMDHGITALTRVKVAQVPHHVIEELPLERPRLGRAMWWSTLVDEATLRAWIVNLGRRDAAERIAHLFCELHARLKLVGLTDDGHFSLPMTQEVLADALGLTSVHVNRVLRRLRSEELIELQGGELTILNLPALRDLAGFDPDYLHGGRLAETR
jgi:CRP-like cAMP-binding protein